MGFKDYMGLASVHFVLLSTLSFMNVCALCCLIKMNYEGKKQTGKQYIRQIVLSLRQRSVRISKEQPSECLEFIFGCKTSKHWAWNQESRRGNNNKKTPCQEWRGGDRQSQPPHWHCRGQRPGTAVEPITSGGRVCSSPGFLAPTLSAHFLQLSSFLAGPHSKAREPGAGVEPGQRLEVCPPLC